jgi:hypothetical protein
VLWDHSFAGGFDNNENYFISPFGAYAFNNDTTEECELKIIYLETTDTSTIILGTTWL